MTREAIFEEVKKLIADSMRVEVSDIKEESKFIDDLGADSLDIVELVMAMESKFDIEIPDDDAQKIRTVGEAVDYLNNRLNSK
ncbi:MAG: acyl carrier protein [Elusimicrobiales bacterium]|nr:acyl carrier protein [Elusimicrobiales bacterium]